MAPKRASKRKAKKTEVAEAAEVAEAELEELLGVIEQLPPDEEEGEPPALMLHKSLLG